ncbi:MAG: hypothetical protein WC223_11290 [Bacteroidales bacterium]|jgi:hypothetical protein
MDSKDKLILDMLKNGKSYTDIQAELKVSPSRIAIVKKQYLNAASSNNNELLQNNSTNNVQPSEVKKVIETKEKPKEKVAIKTEIANKENITDFLTKHEDEFKSFVKDIITTSLDNCTTHAATTSSANSETLLKEHIKVEEKEEISPSNEISFETTTQNSSTTTDNYKISDNTKEISSEVLKLIGKKCHQCDKTFALGMTIVSLEENNKIFYFCCKSCYRKYNKEKKEMEEIECRRRMRRRRMQNNQGNSGF